MSRCARDLGFVPIVVLIALLARPAVAGTQRESLRPLARQIADVVLTDQKQSSIAVGEISADGKLGEANAGPGIAEDLKSLLEELKVRVDQKDARLSLLGSYHKVPDPSNKELVMIKIKVAITNDAADTIGNLSLEVRDTGLIGGILGPTVSFSSFGTREKRNKELQDALREPSYDHSGTLIRSKADSPYAIELLVTSKDQAPADAAGWANVPARAVVNKGGFPFVDIQRDEVYAIRIHNNQPDKLEAAVGIAIDGIDVFHFSTIRHAATGEPKYTHFIVPPGESLITGWHKTNQSADSFLVTEYGKGAASRAKISRGKIGVITIKFALAWSGDAVPEAEKGARDGGNETGQGPPTKTDLKEADRHVGVLRDTISVRYTR